MSIIIEEVNDITDSFCNCFRSNYLFMQNQEVQITDTKIFIAYKKGVPFGSLTKSDIETIMIMSHKMVEDIENEEVRKVCRLNGYTDDISLLIWTFKESEGSGEESIKRYLPLYHEDVDKIYGFILKNLVPHNIIMNKKLTAIPEAPEEESLTWEI